MKGIVLAGGTGTCGGSVSVSSAAPAELMPFLSVVIPVGRIDPSFSCCLQALSRQTLPREFFEVILVPDGVALPTEILAALHPISATTVCEIEAQRGRSSTRNRGLARARGSVAVSLDRDMIASPELLSNYFDKHRHGAAVCMGVRKFVYPYDEMNVSSNQAFTTMLSACFPREDYRESFYRATDFMRRAAEPIWAFSTCNCSYPLDLARQVGLFDE